MEKKREFRKNELNLDLAIRNNKHLMEKVKKASSSVHETENEIVRSIKGIILYKNYADFIHKLLGKEKIKSDLKNIRNSLLNKDKDLPAIAKKVIRQFNFLLNGGEIPVKTEEINNPDLLTALFFSLEGNIIHQMKERDEILRDRFMERISAEKEISEMKKKIELDQNKLDILEQELKTSNNIYIIDDYQERIDDASNFIYDISENLLENQINQNKNQEVLDNVIEASLSKLKKIEDTINDLFAEIEEIKNSDKDAENILKDIFDEIKIKNKRQKLKEGRQALISLEEEKNLKYLKKNYRYKPRGPIVYPPPYILEKKNETDDENKENDVNEEEMLYYYDK